MINTELEKYLNTLLHIKDFKDYCPNGLQIEGKQEIHKVITGVSCNQDLIDVAIEEKADAIIVHHGFFWKNENSTITGIKKNRIAALIKNDINLFAYHLPLDAHPTFGNNIHLANVLGINNPQPIKDSLVWSGNIDTTLDDLSEIILQKLDRKPLVFKNNTNIKKIAWCSGAAQNYIDYAIQQNCDCYISGEVSEQIPAIAKENNISFISAGHHATETGGVQNLATHLQNELNLQAKFIDIKNVV